MSTRWFFFVLVNILCTNRLATLQFREGNPINHFIASTTFCKQMHVFMIEFVQNYQIQGNIKIYDFIYVKCNFIENDDRIVYTTQIRYNRKTSIYMFLWEWNLTWETEPHCESRTKLVFGALGLNFTVKFNKYFFNYFPQSAPLWIGWCVVICTGCWVRWNIVRLNLIIWTNNCS